MWQCQCSCTAAYSRAGSASSTQHTLRTQSRRHTQELTGLCSLLICPNAATITCTPQAEDSTAAVHAALVTLLTPNAHRSALQQLRPSTTSWGCAHNPHFSGFWCATAGQPAQPHRLNRCPKQAAAQHGPTTTLQLQPDAVSALPTTAECK